MDVNGIMYGLFLGLFFIMGYAACYLTRPHQKIVQQKNPVTERVAERKSAMVNPLQNLNKMRAMRETQVMEKMENADGKTDIRRPGRKDD